MARASVTMALGEVEENFAVGNRANWENSPTRDSSALTSRSIRLEHSPTSRTRSGGSFLEGLARLRSR